MIVNYQGGYISKVLMDINEFVIIDRLNGVTIFSLQVGLPHQSWKKVIWKVKKLYSMMINFNEKLLYCDDLGNVIIHGLRSGITASCKNKSWDKKVKEREQKERKKESKLGEGRRVYQRFVTANKDWRWEYPSWVLGCLNTERAWES